MELNLFKIFYKENFEMNFPFFMMFYIIFLFLNKFNNKNLLSLIFFLKKIEMNLFAFKSKVFSNSFFNMNYSYMFLFIFFLNLNTLIFFNYPLTAQFFINLSILFFLWSSSILFFFKKKTVFFYSLCPKNCPILLSFFMVLIEFFSLLIRPISLFLRLTINMLAGHMIFFFLSNFIFFFPFLISILSPFFCLFMMLKIFVCFIQAWILTFLCFLYSSESSKLI